MGWSEIENGVFEGGEAFGAAVAECGGVMETLTPLMTMELS